MNQQEPKEPESISIVPQLILQGDPQKQLEYGKKAAKALMEVLIKKEKKIMLNGKQYLEVGDWQMLAGFFGAVAKIEWTKETHGLDGDAGYEARAVVIQNGKEISAAEAMCTREESKWDSRTIYEYQMGRRTAVGTGKVPSFQLKSMAQTRSVSKALRNAYGWVAILGGFADTPAEEIQDVLDASGQEEGKPKTRGDQKNLKAIRSQETTSSIMRHVLTLAEKPMVKKAEIDAFIKEKTELDMTPENYGEILSRLSVLVREQGPRQALPVDAY